MSEPALFAVVGFVGWRKIIGQGWQAVVEAATESEAWDRMLAAPPTRLHSESKVLRAGISPR